MSFEIGLIISIQHPSDRLFKWEEMSSHAWNCMLRMWAPLRAKSGHWAKYGSIVEKCSSALRQVSSFGEMGLFYISRAFQGSSSVSGMQQQPQQQCWAGPSKAAAAQAAQAEQSRAAAEQRLKSRMERAAVLLAFGELFYPPTLLVSRLHFLAFGEPPRFFSPPLHQPTLPHAQVDNHAREGFE